MHIILGLVQILFAIVVVFVLASYAVRYYELANDPAAENRENISAADFVLALAGEIGAVFIAIVLYPLGLVMRDTPYANLRAGERPIILCHGYMHNKSAFFVLARRLRRDGRNNIVTLSLGPASEQVPFFAERLSEAVERALSHTGCDTVDLVGHSMGGLVVRYYVENLGGAPRVNAAITLGAPNGGTKTAVFGIFKSAEQFKLKSALVAGFAESTTDERSANMVAVWSDFDSVVLPVENACLPEPYENVLIRGVGHVALLYSDRVFEEVRRVLSNEPSQREFANGIS